MKTDKSSKPLFTSREVIEGYRRGINEAVDFVEVKILPVLKGQIDLNKKEIAIIGIFFRIHFLICSLIRLNHKSDFSAVATISRTLFELLLDIKLLSSSKLSKKELDRFFAFPEIDRFKKAKKVIEFQTQHPDLVDKSFLDSKIRNEYINTPGKKEKVEKKVASLWGRTKGGKLKWPNHWTGHSIKDQADRMGPLFELRYLDIYGFLSSYTHSGNTAYSGLSEAALEGVYGISLEISRKMYIESLLFCSKAFSLKAVIESFSQIVSFLENAPNEIMLEYGIKKIKAMETLHNKTN